MRTAPKADGSTSDTQPVFVSLTVRYSISPDKVAEVYEKYSHNGDLSSYVQTASHEIFKAVTARYTAPDLIAQRAKVSADIYSALSAKLAIYGAQVINIDMRNFAFQESYMKAINSKVEQEQLRLAAENKLLTVEAEQKQKVAIAEAEANAVKAEGRWRRLRNGQERHCQRRSSACPGKRHYLKSADPGIEAHRSRDDQGSELEGRTAERRLCRRTYSVLQCRRRSLGDDSPRACHGLGYRLLRRFPYTDQGAICDASAK